MVTKKRGGQKKGTVKVGKLIVNKETFKDLTTNQTKGIQGGAIKRESILCTAYCTIQCTYTITTTV